MLQALQRGFQRRDLGGESTAEFTKIVQSEFDRWGPIVRASGFSSED